MKKIAYTAYCFLFFLVCILPGVLLFHSDEEETSENRQLAELPSFTQEDGSFNKNWSRQMTAYVSDHFGFRQKLVTIDSQMKAALLHTSAEEDVILGEDGWMYYTPTVNDYVGNPTVSQKGIQNIVYNLQMLQTYVENQGGVFLSVIVPNKNTIYPEYMPKRYQNSGIPNNLENLSAAIEETNVHYLNLVDVLSDAKENADTLLYHKTDTHWNNTGALIGYRGIMECLQMPYQNFAEVQYTTQPVWHGDLQKMLFPSSEEMDDQNVYALEYTYHYMGHYRNTDDINITTIQNNENASGSLLMFRDSFGAALIPWFSEQFRSAKYSRARPYPVYNIESEHFDAVVMEIVERNIAWLQKEAPMHRAPRVETVPQTDEACTADLYIDQSSSAYLHLYGTIALPEMTQSAGDYFITLTAPDGNIISYLAYHCYESDLLKTDEIADNGYSLYIPADDLIQGQTYAVTLTVQVEDNCVSCSLGDICVEC